MLQLYVITCTKTSIDKGESHKGTLVTHSLYRPDGITFTALPPPFQPSPKPGEVVTFTYQNYIRHEIPVDPQIQRIRLDISWEDVLVDYASLDMNLQKYGTFQSTFI